MRARGAIPLMLPNTAAGPVVGTPLLPPAVDAVCVPWPSKSRGELNSQGKLGVDAVVAAPTGVEILGADQLLVAHRGVECFAGHALAVPAWDLLVVQLTVFGGVAVRSGAVGEAQALRPDAAVDDADDDAFSPVTPVVVQRPVGPVRPRKAGRRGRVDSRDLVLGHGEHTAGRRELPACGSGQLRRESVEDVSVAVELLAAANRPAPGEHRVLRAVRGGPVVDDRGCSGRSSGPCPASSLCRPLMPPSNTTTGFSSRRTM